MDDNYPSRRSVLKSSAAMASLGIVGSLSGCSSVPFIGGNGGNSNANQRIENVPEGSTFALHVSVGAMLSDDVVQQRLNELLQEQTSQQSGPQSLDEAFGQVESEVGFDPRNVEEMLAFGSVESNTAGSILWTGWEQDAVTTALSENGFSEDSYGGVTVYTQDSMSADGAPVALLDDSTYGFGTPENLRKIIDTWNGDASSVGGDVETAFTSATGGYVQFGFDIPTQQLQGGGGQTAQALRNIEYGYGSVTGADNGREMIVNMEASDGEAAGGIKSLLDIGLGSAQQQLQQISQQSQGDTEDIEEFLTAVNNIETSRNGSTVTVRNSDGITFAIGALAVAATFALGVGSASGGGGGMSSEAPPQANFSGNFDGNALTLTHNGGDMIPAGNLYVSGATGGMETWASLGGSTSGSANGQPAVAAGDTLQLTGVSSDYELRLIWRTGDTSAVLFQQFGPDA